MGDRVAVAFRDEIAGLGLAPGIAQYVGEPTPDAPPPPDGPWLIVHHAAQFHVGASARGQFVVYDTHWEAKDAIDRVVDLLTRPAPAKPLQYDTDECLKRGLWTAAKLTDGRGGEAGPASLQVGDLLDSAEPETAHHR